MKSYITKLYRLSNITSKFRTQIDMSTIPQIEKL